MAKLDIRNYNQEKIDEIVFASGHGHTRHSVRLKLEGGNDKIFFIEAGDSQYVSVHKDDVKNLIKALEKAVELGWDK